VYQRAKTQTDLAIPEVRSDGDSEIMDTQQRSVEDSVVLSFLTDNASHRAWKKKILFCRRDVDLILICTQIQTPLTAIVPIGKKPSNSSQSKFENKTTLNYPLNLIHQMDIFTKHEYKDSDFCHTSKNVSLVSK
jgi:hypothetical protein